MGSTNYRRTFIAVSPDSRAEAGIVPAKAGSVAALQYGLVHDRPYRLTSDDLLFAVHTIRNAIPEDAREAARAAFFAKPQACLRASPLVKTHGWGIHHDDEGRIALLGIGSEAYRTMAARADVTVVNGMRSRRG